MGYGLLSKHESIDVKFLRRALALAGLILVSLSCSCAPAQRRDAIASDEIVILHTNDVHGAVRPSKATWINRDSPPLCGGTASMMTFIRAWRRAAGGDTGILLFDAGDIFQGTPEGNETKGSLMIALMNLLKYDAGAIGNHEFDFGIENVKKLLRESKFPQMAENLHLRGTDERPPEIDGPILLERKGVRIGVAGLITEDLAKVTTWDETAPWHADAEIPAARKTVRELRARGADMVILLTHCGVEHDTMIAEHVDDDDTAPGATPAKIDLIIGGHSHTRLDTAIVQNGIPIVQTGSRGTTIGEIRLRWDHAQHRVSSFHYRLVDLVQSEYPEDTEVKAFLAPWFADIDKRMNRIVGRALKPIARGSRAPVSSALGNLQTDLMRAAAGTEIAFSNKGGLRADVPQGELRLRDLFAVSPFGNTIVTMKLPGATIRAILEQSLSYGTTPLEFSGMTVWFDQSRSPRDRVVNIFVGGKPIGEERLYTVATNSFLAGGGDGYPWFRDGVEIHDTGRNILDVEVAHYESHPEGVAGPEERRWRSIDQP